MEKDSNPSPSFTELYVTDVQAAHDAAVEAAAETSPAPIRRSRTRETGPQSGEVRHLMIPREVLQEAIALATNEEGGVDFSRLQVGEDGSVTVWNSSDPRKRPKR